MMFIWAYDRILHNIIGTHMGISSQCLRVKQEITIGNYVNNRRRLHNIG